MTDILKDSGPKPLPFRGGAGGGEPQNRPAQETHDDPAKDARRDAKLREFGYHVLRVTNEDVMRNIDGVLVMIAEALHLSDSPHSGATRAPSPKGEGFDGANFEGSAG